MLAVRVQTCVQRWGSCRHAPECLKYLAKLRNRDVFRFCAIPQVMAIATLAKIYNNPKVFTGAEAPKGLLR